MDEPLPGIDWTDVCGDEQPRPERARYDPDLDGQGLTAFQRHTMTEIRPVGDYL